MAYDPFKAWGQYGGSRDMQGLNDNLVNAITGGGGPGTGLATEATLLQVRDELIYSIGDIEFTTGTSTHFTRLALYSTVGGVSAADLLEEMLVSIGAIDSNTDKLALPNSAVSFDSVPCGEDGPGTVTELNTWKADHPTYIMLNWERCTGGDGDYLIIRYTT